MQLVGGQAPGLHFLLSAPRILLFCGKCTVDGTVFCKCDESEKTLLTDGRGGGDIMLLQADGRKWTFGP